MSYEYFAVPVVLAGPSARSMRLPMSVRFSAGGQSTFNILSSSSFPAGRVCHGEQHASIRAAPTQVATEPGAHLVDAGVGMLSHKCRGRGDEAWCAKAALLGVMFYEGFLHGIHFFGRAETFHGGDLPTFRLNCEHGTGINGFVIHQHRASAAGAAVANFFRAGNIEPVAERI